jgi:methylated-DNA-protein-cysteine methyltransferase related protein
MTERLESFADRVYWLVGMIPEGRVVTYGQVASYAGSPGAARAVGDLMRDSLGRGVDVPWQRVINASGGISHKGDFARAALQRALLVREGVEFSRGGRCDLSRFGWSPDASSWSFIASFEEP